MRHRDDAAVKISEIELFVRGVQIIVGQTNPEEHARNAELLLKGRNDWNGAPLAREHGSLAEAFLDRAPGGADVRAVELGHPRFAAMEPRQLQLDRRRRDLLDVRLELFRNLVGILIRD